MSPDDAQMPGSGDRSPEQMAEMVEHARDASDLLKALAHEGRLLILCMLVEGEKSVTELEDILGAGQPVVSQQLARLRADNLVQTRRHGKHIYYSLASTEAREVVTLLYELFCRRAQNGGETS